jgi:hypothetical protein
MTHQQQAAELIERFVNQPINFPFIDSDNDHCVGSGYMTYKSAVKCALVAVDVLMNNLLGKEFCFKDGEPVGDYKYWQAVKDELNRL